MADRGRELRDEAVQAVPAAAPRREPGARPGGAALHTLGDVEVLLALQRTAGNGAVTGLVDRSAARGAGLAGGSLRERRAAVLGVGRGPGASAEVDGGAAPAGRVGEGDAPAGVLLGGGGAGTAHAGAGGLGGGEGGGGQDPGGAEDAGVGGGEGAAGHDPGGAGAPRAGLPLRRRGAEPDGLRGRWWTARHPGDVARARERLAEDEARRAAAARRRRPVAASARERLAEDEARRAAAPRRRPPVAAPAAVRAAEHVARLEGHRAEARARGGAALRDELARTTARTTLATVQHPG